jgi:hypothetical protein
MGPERSPVRLETMTAEALFHPRRLLVSECRIGSIAGTIRESEVCCRSREVERRPNRSILPVFVGVLGSVSFDC